jgi:hypothetical protein
MPPAPVSYKSYFWNDVICNQHKITTTKINITFAIKRLQSIKVDIS